MVFLKDLPWGVDNFLYMLKIFNSIIKSQILCKDATPFFKKNSDSYFCFCTELDFNLERGTGDNSPGKFCVFYLNLRINNGDLGAMQP